MLTSMVVSVLHLKMNNADLDALQKILYNIYILAKFPTQTSASNQHMKIYNQKRMKRKSSL